MPDDFNEQDLQEFKTGGSKSGLRKLNALVKGLKKLLKDQRKGRSGYITLYLNTDSVPIVVQVPGTVVGLSTQDGGDPGDGDGVDA
jgi:hypothetical protein